MKNSLSSLFRNQTETVVLETLYRVGIPIHLRGLADIAEVTASSIQASIDSLTQSKLVKSKRVGQKRYFSINSESAQAKKLAAIIALNEQFRTLEDNPRLDKALSFALQLTDDVSAMRLKKKPVLSCKDLFLEVVALFEKNNLQFRVSGELARSIYRHQVKTINSFEFLVDRHEPENLLKVFSQSNLFKEITRLSDKIFLFADLSLTPISLKVVSDKVVEPLSTRMIIDNNTIQFLTIEDTLVQLCLELRNDNENSLIMDDISSILQSKKKLDLAYLIAQMHKYKVTFPPPLKHLVPSLLQRISRDWGVIERKNLGQMC